MKCPKCGSVKIEYGDRDRAIAHDQCKECGQTWAVRVVERSVRDISGFQTVDLYVVDEARDAETVATIRRLSPLHADRKPADVLHELRQTGKVFIGRYYKGEGTLLARQLEQGRLSIELVEVSVPDHRPAPPSDQPPPTPKG